MADQTYYILVRTEGDIKRMRVYLKRHPQLPKMSVQGLPPRLTITVRKKQWPEYAEAISALGPRAYLVTENFSAAMAWRNGRSVQGLL